MFVIGEEGITPGVLERASRMRRLTGAGPPPGVLAREKEILVRERVEVMRKV